MTRLPLTCAARLFLAAALLILPVAATAANVDLGKNTTTGKVPLESIGPLTFGADGVLFVGDSTGAAIFAIDTGDTAKAAATELDVSDIKGKIAATLGTSADNVEINDMATNPMSNRIYFSATRNGSQGAQPAIVTYSDGKLALFDLGKARYSRAALDNAPGEDATDRRGRPLRREALTDLEYIDGTLLVTGLSNEEFSSKLRKVGFPFQTVGAGTSVEIFHGAHGRWETNAPVRTMALYDIEGVSHVLAAYTCTPLVRFSVDELSDGNKVMGTTVAELGNRNRPLDMVVYEKGGEDFVLMANSSRGVMKIDLDKLTDIEAITERVPDKAGLPYETLGELQGIDQLTRYGDAHAVLLSSTDESSRLFTIALP